MQIHLGYEAMTLARARLREAAEQLEEARSTAGRQVENLMDGGWGGAAADAFNDAWLDWLRGAAHVREALEQIELALCATQRDLTARDEDAEALLAQLRGWIGT
jgi:WXG100 family type VII secretion target